MFPPAEIQSCKENKQLTLNVQRKLKDPRKEKLKDFRKGIKGVHFNKECKAARQEDYRQYRTKMKQLMRTENYERLHDYTRTSGWLTW